MDKNTVIGMLLMCAVIFGFMYCQSDNKDQKQSNNKQTAKSEKVEEKKVTEANDILTEDDLSSLNDYIALNGAISDSVFNLKSENEKVVGTVNVGDTTFNIDSLCVMPQMANPRHAEAVKSVRNILDNSKTPKEFSACHSGAEETVTLKNDSIEIEISSKGAMIKKATLKGYTAYHSIADYKTKNSKPVEIVSEGNNNYFFVLSNNNNQPDSTSNLYFTPINKQGTQKGDTTVTMSLENLPYGAKWQIKYTLEKDSYMVRMEIIQKNMDKIMPRNTTDIRFVWNQKMRRQEAGKEFEERYSSLYWKLKGDDDVDDLGESGKKEKSIDQEIKWISAKSQFFSTALIADKCFTGTKLISTAYDKGKDKEYDKYLKKIEVYSNINYSPSETKPASFYLYMGPNRYNLLSSYDKYSKDEDLHLTRLVSLGWKLFRWINSAIVMPVFNWLRSFGWSLGIVILVLTILLKLVLWPLTYKSYMSQAKMKILQPDIKAINEKYPDQADAMKKQQKIMELYKQAGANPMGGCLPMLLQMPFLIAMFWFFPSSIDLRGQEFLWAPDLSAPDAIIPLPFSIPWLGDRLSIFCLLMTVTNIAYTYVNMQSQSSSSMPGMKWMMYLMPVMFLFFFNKYASGLSYYYFISLLITILQTFLTRMMVKEDKVRAVMAENAKKPKKKSGFMARLEEAQRKQQEALKQQQKRNNRRR